MDPLTSKLQYKNYEQGEFIEEQERSLDETLELIKNFPWNEQRGVTIEMTCPSVTIYNLYYGYLKIAIYFNGKFIAYHLDNEKHLYERPLPNLDDVTATVTEFFNHNLDLSKYDKKIFSFGAAKEFENGNFFYSTGIFAVFFQCLLLLFLILMAGIGTFAMFRITTPTAIIPIWICLDVIIAYASYAAVRIYLKAQNVAINISSGHNDFEMWDNGALKKYYKSDIATVTTYGAYSRGSRIFKLMEMNFKDDSKVTISGLLMDPITFVQKFPDNPKIDVRNTFSIWKVFWKYIKG